MRLRPDRDPAPVWPRPEVLPNPDPSPRPTRFLGRLEFGDGLRLCRPILPIELFFPVAIVSYLKSRFYLRS